MVRDGSTIRAFVLPTFEYVTVMMTGIKCPMFKIDGDKQTPEPFAEEAKFFTESRLLQREIQIVFEGNFCSCLYSHKLLRCMLHLTYSLTTIQLYHTAEAIPQVAKAMNTRLIRRVSCFPLLFDFMMALRSTETHNITLKKPRPI